jgi:predicted dehydrogenase
MMDARDLRFGIIGFGRFAEKTIGPAIRETPGATLVALQKRSRVEAEAAARSFGVPHAFTQAEDLVRHPEVDAVFVVSANAAHCAETIAAARAGKHVIVEKPMAMTVAEAEEMIDACRRANVRLMVAHMIRLSPAMQRVRELLAGGEIGRISCVRADFVYDGRMSQRGWLLDRRVAGGGPVFDIGVHCLDTVRFLLGSEVEEVRSVLSPRPTAEITEQTAHMALRFGGGTTASITCSYESGARRSLLEVFGTDGMISVLDFTVGSRRAVVSVTRAPMGKSPSTTTEAVDVPNLYVAEIAQFVECVRNGTEPALSGDNGLRNQRVLNAVVGGQEFRAGNG